MPSSERAPRTARGGTGPARGSAAGPGAEPDGGSAPPVRALALRLLARRGRSRGELAARLARAGAPAPAAEAVLAELESRGYLDDAATAGAWATRMVATRRWGPGRLLPELRRRGFAEPLAQAVTREVFAAVDELGLARAAARRRAAALGRGRAGRTAARLAGFLERQGFSDGIIARVVDEMAQGFREP